MRSAQLRSPSEDLAFALHSARGMRRPGPRVPQSYDEIVRRTVPDPDSSKRPTARQEQLAREGFRALDEHEQALHARVFAALDDPSGIEIEVDRETVTLRGHVANAEMIAHVEELVGGVEGVASVVNHLVVRT